MPLLDSPRSRCTVGAAIDTIVWSMNVIATAKIIAVRIRPFDWPLADCPLALAVCVIPVSLRKPQAPDGCTSRTSGSHARHAEREAARATVRPRGHTTTAPSLPRCYDEA